MPTDLKTKWEIAREPGSETTATAFAKFYDAQGASRKILNCAVPLSRARQLTDFQMPEGWDADKCFATLGWGKFVEGLDHWRYQPRIRAQAQLPQMVTIPQKHGDLMKSPWFQSTAQGLGLGINARHLRYHHDLWSDLKPKVLRGLHTTLVFVSPQLGHALTPHVQLDKLPWYFSSLSRVAAPIQLFPARYLFPDANLGGCAEMPTPIFADLLPCTGGYAFPVEDCTPTPWGEFAYFDGSDKYYGYPFSRVLNSAADFTLSNVERGTMLLPDGERVAARASESHVYATLDEKLNAELQLSRDGFERARCLARGTITHDGLPFVLPVEMQPLVYAIILTHWEMELDRPGVLSSYTVRTKHAAIRGYSFYQKVKPYYDSFMRLPRLIAQNPDFKCYPLANHLNHSWLGGNLRISNQASPSEQEIGADLMRNYYLQQLDWQVGVANLWNHVQPRKAGELAASLGQDGLLFHQMRRMLRFDSHLFPRPVRRPSLWPNLHPGWAQLDRYRESNQLPRI